jgi:hypothetical protein
VAAVLVALATTVAFPLDAFGFGATGNAAAIRFFRVAATTTNALPAYVLVQNGWMRASDSVAKDQVAWAWGFAQFDSRIRIYPARERIVLVQHGGTPVWLEDLITPLDPGCHQAACRQYPIEIVVHRTQAYEGIVLSGGHAKCFKKEALDKVPYTVTAPFWVAVGRFSKLVARGSLTQVTSTYGNEGQQVTETDLIATRTHVFAHSHMSAAAAAGRRAFVYWIAHGRLATVPKAPAITLCS